MRARREHAHVLRIEVLPAEIAALGVVRERAQIARVVGRGVRRQAPLLREVREIGVDLGAIDAASHRYGRDKASVMRSPMRFRNSVLMPGWKRSRSALP